MSFIIFTLLKINFVWTLAPFYMFVKLFFGFEDVHFIKRAFLFHLYPLFVILNIYRQSLRLIDLLFRTSAVLQVVIRLLYLIIINVVLKLVFIWWLISFLSLLILLMRLAIPFFLPVDAAYYDDRDDQHCCTYRASYHDSRRTMQCSWIIHQCVIIIGSNRFIVDGKPYNIVVIINGIK